MLLLPDKFGENIFLWQGDHQPMARFYDFFAGKAPLAMMAVLLSELVTRRLAVPMETFNVIVLDQEDFVALSLEPVGRMTKAEAGRFFGFCDLMGEVARSNRRLYAFNPEYAQAEARTPRDLMHFLQDLTEAAGIKLGTALLDDPEKFHAEFKKRARHSWRQEAESVLRSGWATVALPEKAFVDPEDLLKEVYRMNNSFTYDFVRIEEALSKYEKNATKPNAGPAIN